MIGIELWSVIRRWRRREYFPISEISRRTGLWRDAIRKYLRTDSVDTRSNIWKRASAHAIHELTFKLDQPVGADQVSL
jgi:hypothetical protein